jgi:hypothetical protein
VKDYTYSPVVALILAPVADLNIVRLWHLWTAATIAALVGSAGVFTIAFVEPKRRVIMFSVCAVTALRFWPTVAELFLGQVDAFVLLALVAGCAARRQRVAGAFIGMGGVIKTWPTAFAAGLHRKAMITAFGVAALSLLLALPWDARTLVTRTFAKADQRLVSNSVWGIPKANFSTTGIANPILVSNALRWCTTVALLLLVAAMAYIALRHLEAPIRSFTLAMLVVIALPVSHLGYQIFALPIIWWWCNEAISARDRTRIAGTIVMILWWLTLGHSWVPFNDPFVTSLRYSIVFVADLLALTVSTLLATSLHLTQTENPHRARTT